MARHGTGGDVAMMLDSRAAAHRLGVAPQTLANGLATASAAGFLISIMAVEGNMILSAIASGLALASIMAARFLWAEIEAITGHNDLTKPEVER